MNFKRHFNAVYFVVFLIFFSQILIGQVNDQVATGAIPPNLSQIAEMSRTMVETLEVLPNQIAQQRTNNMRLLQGRPPSFEYITPMAGEVLTKAQISSLKPAQSPFIPSTLQSLGVPCSVDNSLLVAFPPIRHQGGIGSCSAFSATYLVGTHMLALARGSNAKSESDNSNKLSPKFTYSIANGGMDEGSWITGGVGEIADVTR